MAAKLLGPMLPEPIEAASPEREGCIGCGRWDAEPVHTPRFSQWQASEPSVKRIFCVMETPLDLEQPTLTKLRQYLKWVKSAPCTLALAPAVRCGSKEPSMKPIRACRPFLLQWMQDFQPTHILLMGELAIKAGLNRGSDTGVITHRGRALVLPDLPGIPAYATYGMAGILAGDLHLEERILEDFARTEWAELPYPPEAWAARKAVSVDTEYSPTGELLTLGVATPEAAIAREPGEAGYAALEWCIQGAEVLIAHSASGDVDQLVKLGLCKPDWARGINVRDTYLLARMTDENRGPGAYNVESLLMSAHNVKPWKGPTEAIGTNALEWGAPFRKERCRLDAWAAAILNESPEPVPGPVELTHQIGMVLGRIEKAGVYVDLTRFETWRDESFRERERLRRALTSIAEQYELRGFEPTNDNHIRDMLFKKLNFPVQKKTETKKACVNKHTLNKFKDSPFVQHLIAFNKIDKIYGTQIEGVRSLIVDPVNVGGVDIGRIPVHLSPVTRTGRRASQKPNMQNWPKAARQMVRSRFKGGQILELDYKSLEPFLLAYVAKEPKLDEYFRHKGGYIGIAREIFKKEVDKQSTDYKAIKGVVLGTNYNATPWTIATNLRDNLDPPVLLDPDWRTHVNMTEDLQADYFNLFPGLRRYMQECEDLICLKGKVWTLTGRERHLPVESTEADCYKHMVNQAINYRIQGLASDVTGSALIDVETMLVEMYMGGDILEYHKRLLNRDWPKMPILINEIHDALLLDVPPDDCSEYTIQCIEQMMCAVPTLRRLLPDFDVQLMVDRKLGETWGLD